ncbi:MAG: hypothetical protein P0Y48_07890 [Candidatus Microbacterium phytovorans]|uniref:Uncharacterized protein n=1 Tax=Candidatus Microbacterium phytovorans TaxID=3121374 RepID=A0AAJ5VXW8_9MICO|nr:hypothetical protein [Microbacterium sp.]WEK12401.1 MAG: hypothetical protein P0Y48_07890 [Microbacterium sp.]
MVLVAAVVTGCAAQPVPTGAGLYAQAKGHYLAYRAIATDILTAVYDGEWEVGGEGAGYGALPGSCDGNRGYDFNFTRYLRSPDPALRAERYEAAAAAITAAGLDASISPTDDPDAIWVIIARGNGISRLVFDSTPHGGGFHLNITTDCHPGDSEELVTLLFDEPTPVFDATPYFPKTERPDAEPLFLFPLDAPRYPDPTPTP